MAVAFGSDAAQAGRISGAPEPDLWAPCDSPTVSAWRQQLMAGLGIASGGQSRGSGTAGQAADAPGEAADAASEAANSAELVDLIAALEALKSAACAVQAEAALALDRAERDRQAAHGVPVRRRGLGVAAQVGLARQESPHRGATLLGAAKVWLAEMPHTFSALRAGRISEHGATLLVQETACLELEDRREVDALVCGDPATLAGVGTRQMVAMARRHAARLDPAAVVRRARRAASERCVTLRPAPDSMAYLTSLLPVAQGVAAYAALCRAADMATVVPDGASGSVEPPRSRGQLMADTLVERVTGQSSALAVPVTVDLVLNDAALLGAGHEPAHLQGAGPVPAQVARELVAAGLDANAAWLRRLYADPGGDLVAMTSKARFFPDGLADFLRIRDQGICRTPYCGAPIRHIDHIEPFSAGGATSADNGQGLCVACNLAKEAPGWRHRVSGVADARAIEGVGTASGMGSGTEGGCPTEGLTSSHVIETLTPTAHRYLSRRPVLAAPARAHPGLPAPAESVLPAPADPALTVRSVVDVCFGNLVAEYVEFAA